MIGGGEFIINGAERVVVSQLHRSPGVDFVVEIEAGDRKLHACRIIPERGSWIELQVTKKETLGVRIDQSGKFSSMTLLRAMSPRFSSDEAILVGLLRDRGRRHRRPEGGGEARRAGRLRRRRRPDHRRDPDRERHDHLEDHGAGPRRRQARRDHRPEGGQRPAHPPVAPGRPDHRPRERPAADLPAAPAGQPAAAREGARAVPREVLRHQPIPPGQGRPVPDQPQVQPDDPRGPDDPGPRGLRQRDPLHPQPPQGQGARRRHRPPGQPPAPDHRRAGRGRAPQGVPQAPPHRPGADEPQGRRGHDAAVADQPQEHQRGDRILLRPRRAVAGRRPDQPAGAAHRTSVGSRRWARAA